MRTIEIDIERQQQLMDGWVEDTHYVEQAGWDENELPSEGVGYPEDQEEE